MTRSLRVLIMTRKNESITLSLSETDKQILEQLAIKHNCMWGKKPNISKLIQQIVMGRLKIVAESDKDLKAQSLWMSADVQQFYKLLKEQEQSCLH